MYNNEAVSVIIPVYNAGKFIGKTIESAINQTYKDIEIVLVDDYSKDNSRQIIKQYADNYGSIIYHFQEKNFGVAVARNTALEIAKGRYVAFLDSDDIWLPEKIEKQLKLMKQKNASISYTAIDMIDKDGRQLKGKRKVADHIDYRFLLKNTMLATSSIVIDRGMLGDFRMPLVRSGQDYSTWLQLMRSGVIAHGINDVLVHYRVSNNSLSSNKLKSIKQVWTIQVQNEGIGKLTATFNTLCFCFNAFKKHYL